MVEVTVVATGKTTIMSYKQFYKQFGREQGKEILAGYLSAEIVAIRLVKGDTGC